MNDDAIVRRIWRHAIFLWQMRVFTIEGGPLLFPVSESESAATGASPLFADAGLNYHLLEYVIVPAKRESMPGAQIFRPLIPRKSPRRCARRSARRADRA